MYKSRMIPNPAPSEKKLLGERTLLLTLAAIQFTTVLDFIIILPLSSQYMRVFHITTDQFGLMVSAYAIAAGIAGIAASFFLDRFDRKQALLWLYFGFGLGTLCCALAPTYHLLVAARFISGAFGGLAGALILAIIGDVVPYERRGSAMGLVMSSFSISQIIGVPLGLVLANYYDWHSPFFVIAALSGAILFAVAKVLPSLRSHMEHASDKHPAAHMLAVLKEPDHQKAFLFMAVLMFAGFLVFPYLAAYMVSNVGMTERQLPWIYLSGGVFTLFSMNLIGRWSDRSGKHRVFVWMSLAALVPIVLLTNLRPVPLFEAVAATTLMMICMSGRSVPAMAMITGSVEARYRGGFMSINSSVQQFSMAVAAYLGGHLLGQTKDGKITGFSTGGVLSAFCVVLCIYLARFLKPPAKKDAPEEVVMMEG